MANRKHTENIEGKETVEFFKDLDKDALKTERFLERNAKLLSGVFIGLIVIALGYYMYKQFIVAPKNEEAMKGFFVAQKNMEEGKIKEALGSISSANPGFLGTYDKYSETNVGQLAAYNAAMLKYQEGKYKETLDLLEGFSSDNEVLMALKYGAMADAKSGMNQNDQALELMEKAIKVSEDGYTQYYFTRRAGILALVIGKKEIAKKHFLSIDDKFKEYDNELTDMYIEMAKYL